MDEWLFMEGHRCRGPWFMTHFTVPGNSFKVGLPGDQNTPRRQPIFCWVGTFDKDLSL
jgi:hypothetical protein